MEQDDKMTILGQPTHAALPDNDIPTPPVPQPIDRVIDDLVHGRVIPRDRYRLGDALDRANAEGRGHKAKGFDHIVGRVAGGAQALTGRA